MKTKRRFPIGPARLRPGERQIIEVDGKSIGLFNVDGQFFALHNRCPHMGGALCAGPVTGTTLFTLDKRFLYGRKNELVRCGWHGWEFEIKTGRCLVNDKLQARRYEVVEEDGELVLIV